MIAQHTPGPWHAHEPASVAEPDHTYWHIYAGCGFYDDSEGARLGFNLSGYIREADAKLVAAAPELLEALKVVNTFAKATIARLGLTDTNGICEAADAAIAKAEGRS